MTKAKAQTNSTKTNDRATTPVVISTGCPRGIGPEVAVVAAHRLRRQLPLVLVGDRELMVRAARRRALPEKWIASAPDWSAPSAGAPWSAPLSIYDPGPALDPSERWLGRPREQDGLAQLRYIEAAFELCKSNGWALTTGPVSKEVIAHSGPRRALKFRGHTEWLEELDGAPYSVMCFQSQRLTTSLVTTHVPVKKLTRLLSAELVRRAIVELCDLLARVGRQTPKVVVCSLNPHAGEGELLGSEERTAIIPGVADAQRALGKRARILGPIGAETAYRKAAAGAFDGVVAMYHDQATIPMKLLAFGDAVNVTQGLSIVRTSVDHGTAYDIAKRGVADERGMIAAIQLAQRLAMTSRSV